MGYIITEEQLNKLKTAYDDDVTKLLSKLNWQNYITVRTTDENVMNICIEKRAEYEPLLGDSGITKGVHLKGVVGAIYYLSRIEDDASLQANLKELDKAIEKIFSSDTPLTLELIKTYRAEINLKTHDKIDSGKSMSRLPSDEGSSSSHGSGSAVSVSTLLASSTAEKPLRDGNKDGIRSRSSSNDSIISSSSSSSRNEVSSTASTVVAGDHSAQGESVASSRTSSTAESLPTDGSGNDDKTNLDLFINTMQKEIAEYQKQQTIFDRSSYKKKSIILGNLSGMMEKIKAEANHDELRDLIGAALEYIRENRVLLATHRITPSWFGSTTKSSGIAETIYNELERISNSSVPSSGIIDI